MSRRYWGTLYLVRPEWHGDREDSHEAVVDTYQHGPSHIAVATELWRLVGNEDRAVRIENLLRKANGRDDPVLNADEIDELLRLLDGLDTALEASLIDAKWKVAPNQLPELRRRTNLLDLDESRGDLAVYGVAEGLSRVFALRNFLKDARERGLYVALD